MSTSTKNIESDIRAADDHFQSLFAQGDAAGMSELYTEEGMLLPTGSDFIQGKQGIQSFWQAVMDMGIKQAQLEIVEVERHGDTAVELGRYTLGGADQQVLDQGKYVVIWKREDGAWKLHRDIWNSSLAQE